jgi:hypothetical protein
MNDNASLSVVLCKRGNPTSVFVQKPHSSSVLDGGLNLGLALLSYPSVPDCDTNICTFDPLKGC